MACHKCKLKRQHYAGWASRVAILGNDPASGSNSTSLTGHVVQDIQRCVPPQSDVGG